MITISPTTNSQNFGTIQTRFNQLAALFTSNTVTVDNTASGSFSSGNGYIQGWFGISNLYATNFSGGAPNSSANLSIISNTIFLNGVTQIFSILSNSTVSSVLYGANVIAFPNGTTVNGQITFSNVVTHSVNLIANGVSVVNLSSNNSAITSVLTIGNSTVNATINSTAFSQTANNATNLGGQGIAYFANVTAPVFSTSVNVGANVNLTTSTVTVGNSTVNSSINSTTWFLGNSTVNATVNSTIYTGAAGSSTTALTANNATNFGGHAVAFFANTTNPVFTTTVGVGANVNINTTAISIGNSTVNLSINSTAFTGAVNNALFFAGQPASYYANITSPIFTTTVNVGANVSVNSTGFFAGNSTVNVTINSTSIFVPSANIVMGVGQLSISNNMFFAGGGLSLNQGTSSLDMSGTEIDINDSVSGLGTEITGNLIVFFDSNTEFSQVNLTSFSVGNATVNAIVNSTAFSGTANNATNFAGQGQAFYANVTSPVITTSVNVGANVSVTTSQIRIGNSTIFNTINSTAFSGTANSATNFGGQAASFYAPLASPTFTGTVSVGANVTVNTSSIYVGNSTVFTSINSTAITATISAVIDCGTF